VPASADLDSATGLCPLSHTQEQLWLVDRLDPGNAAYNTTVRWRLAGPLDVGALTRSLAAVVRRQEVLRAHVVSVAGIPYQLVADRVPLPLTVTDLTNLPERGRDAEADLVAGRAAHRPFDLGKPPLFRAELIKTHADRHILALVIHHIICDGWSIQVLLQEVADVYAGLVLGADVRLRPLTAQFTDYARQQRQLLAGPRGRALTDYWARQLAGAPVTLDLPADRPRPSQPSFRGDRCFFALPRTLREQLVSLGRQCGATLFMVTLAGFSVLLARLSAQQDLLIGTPIGNRDRPEWQAVVGYFADTVVIRADLSGDPTFRELLARVRAAAIGAFVHRELPFRLLVEHVRPERATNRNPVFQVMFILQNIPPRRRQLELPGLTMTRLEDLRSTSIFDLRCDLTEVSGELTGQLEYNSDLFDRATVQELAGRYLALLAHACADPDSPVAALSLGAASRTAADFNDDLEDE
jgi:condensation domain-containing protein